MKEALRNRKKGDDSPRMTARRLKLLPYMALPAM